MNRNHVVMLQCRCLHLVFIKWQCLLHKNYSVLLKIAACSSEQLAAVIEHLEEFGETNTSLILGRNPALVIIKDQTK